MVFTSFRYADVFYFRQAVYYRLHLYIRMAGYGWQQFPKKYI
jgi:hypothetical protein